MSDILTQHGRWPTSRGKILMGIAADAKPNHLEDIPGLRYWNDAYISATTETRDNNAVCVVVKVIRHSSGKYRMDEIEYESLICAHEVYFTAFKRAVDRCPQVCYVNIVESPAVQSVTSEKLDDGSYETSVVISATLVLDTGDFPKGQRLPKHIEETKPYIIADMKHLRSGVTFRKDRVLGWGCACCGANYFTADESEGAMRKVPHAVDCNLLEIQERVLFLVEAQPELSEFIK